MQNDVAKIVKDRQGVAEDDLRRATLSFRGQGLSQLHGESGKTRQEILEGYQRRCDHLSKCLAWVTAQRSVT